MSSEKGLPERRSLSLREIQNDIGEEVVEGGVGQSQQVDSSLLRHRLQSPPHDFHRESTRFGVSLETLQQSSHASSQLTRREFVFDASHSDCLELLSGVAADLGGLVSTVAKETRDRGPRVFSLNEPLEDAQSKRPTEGRASSSTLRAPQTDEPSRWRRDVLRISPALRSSSLPSSHIELIDTYTANTRRNATRRRLFVAL